MREAESKPLRVWPIGAVNVDLGADCTVVAGVNERLNPDEPNAWELKPEAGTEERDIGVETLLGIDMPVLVGPVRMAGAENEGLAATLPALPPPKWPPPPLLIWPPPPPPPPPCEAGFWAVRPALTSRASRGMKRRDCIIWTSTVGGPRGKQEQYPSAGAA
jgi:hypothetical protein